MRVLFITSTQSWHVNCEMREKQAHVVQSTAIDCSTINIDVPRLRRPATNRTVNRNALNFQHGHMAGMEACNIVGFQISRLARYLAALSAEHQMSTSVHNKTCSTLPADDAINFTFIFVRHGCLRTFFSGFTDTGRCRRQHESRWRLMSVCMQQMWS